MARRADVVSLRDELTARLTLTRLAEECGTTYHGLYQLVRAQGLRTVRVGARGKALTEDGGKRVRAHYSRESALLARATRLPVACQRLDLDEDTVTDMLHRGVLVADTRAHDGTRMITNDSLDRALARRRPQTAPAFTATVTWLEAKQILGHGYSVQSLVAAGRLITVTQRRRRYVETRSLIRLLAEESPERLGLLA